MSDLPPAENRAPTDGFPDGWASMAPEIAEDGSNADSATNTTGPNRISNASTNINVTINDLSGSSLQDLQNFFTSSGGKNLVIYVGHPQIMSNSPLDSNLRMPLDTRGFPDGYFRIRAAGSQHYLALHGGDSSKDGNIICLCDRSDGSQNQARRFFVNSRGELCTDSTHIDVMDNTLIASHERPPTFPWPNPWSHKLATFCYSKETRMINVKLYADPLISNQWPRPEQEWKDKEFVIAARPPTATRVRPADEISRWAPNLNLIRWTNRTKSLKANAWEAVGVEEKAEMMKLEDVNRIKWEIEQFL